MDSPGASGTILMDSVELRSTLHDVVSQVFAQMAPLVQEAVRSEFEKQRLQDGAAKNIKVDTTSPAVVEDAESLLTRQISPGTTHRDSIQMAAAAMLRAQAASVELPGETSLSTISDSPMVVKRKISICTNDTGASNTIEDVAGPPKPSPAAHEWSVRHIRSAYVMEELDTFDRDEDPVADKMARLSTHSNARKRGVSTRAGRSSRGHALKINSGSSSPASPSHLSPATSMIVRDGRTSRTTKSSGERDFDGTSSIGSGSSGRRMPIEKPLMTIELDPNGLMYTRTMASVRPSNMENLEVWASEDDDGATSGFIFRSLSTVQSIVGARMQKFALKVVRHPRWEALASVFICINAFLLGWQTEYEASHGDVPSWILVGNLFFCVFFTLEIVFRFVAYRIQFIYMRSWKWNLFDLLLVILQIADEIIVIVEHNDPSMKFSFIRVMRFLRLARIARLVRTMRLVRDMRHIIASIVSSMRTLMWTVVILLFLIALVSIYITQMVTDHPVDFSAGPAEEQELLAAHLDHYFGNLSRTMMSMFQSITGGVDWEHIVNPLSSHISWAFRPLIAFYIAFSQLAMLNVVTGVFVDSVLHCAKIDKDLFVLNNVREMFLLVDGGWSGQMTWDIFQEHLDTPAMKEYFKAVDVHVSEARGLFKLLDLDNSDSIDAEEFLAGCMRLRGPAKALDQALLMQEVKYLNRTVHQMLEQSAL